MEHFKLRMKLGFFDETNKTEKATPRKKNKFRSEGRVAKSTELTTAIAFLAFFCILKFFGAYIIERMCLLLKNSYTYQNLIISDFNNDKAINLEINVVMQVVLISAPIIVFVMLASVILELWQVGLRPTGAALGLKLERLNPVIGSKKLFSKNILFELTKVIMKFGIIAAVIFFTLWQAAEKVGSLLQMKMIEGLSYFANLIIVLGINVGLCFLLLAVVDFGFIKFKQHNELKMTRHELREELKMTEGNPQIKRMLRQKMQNTSAIKIINCVPKADVVIADNVYYAVALCYKNEEDFAPKVIAKGADILAIKIKEVAKKNKIVVIEKKEITRTIYNNVELGGNIPPNLYEDVAEILASISKKYDENYF